MGPTSGGSIGSQGWWDASSPPHLLLAVHCLMPHSAGRHVAQASRPVLGPSGPDRPRDRLGPTSGGSIGSQGMGDPVYLFVLCSAVPAVHSDMPVWYGALYCISLDLHRSSQTWRPSGTYFRRVHRISGYGRPCVPLSLLRSSRRRDD